MATDFYGNLIGSAITGTGVPQAANRPLMGAAQVVQGDQNPGSLFGAGNVGAAAPFNPTRQQATAYAQANGLAGWDQAFNAMKKEHQAGTLSPTYGGTAGVNSSGGWMSPEQMRAATNSLQGSQNTNGGGTGSGSGGIGSGGVGSGSEGGVGGGITGNTPQGNALSSALSPANLPSNAPPNFPATQYSPGGAVSYPAPQQGGMGALPGGGQLQMQQSDPNAALNGYLNTPGNQLLGQGAGQYFQQSPGYQYAMNQAMNQVQQNASARGLLESGSALRGMTDRAQGMASQEYNNWWNQQSQLYGDYQNRLAGLAGGNTGADQAYQTGTNLGAGAMQTGSNMGSLFGNLGNAGLSGMANTGAAQAGNINNAGNSQAQVNAANQATQLAGATLQNRSLF